VDLLDGLDWVRDVDDHRIDEPGRVMRCGVGSSSAPDEGLDGARLDAPDRRSRRARSSPCRQSARSLGDRCKG
jgi:hypothetical protein